MSTAKKSLIGAGVGLVALAAAGGGGLFYGHQRAQGPIAAAEERAVTAESALEEAQTTHDREIGEVREELATARRRTSLLEARRQLAVALDQIDARNFGLAQQHCRLAARQLATVRDDHAVEELTTQLDGYRFEVGGNFDQSRLELRRFARSLDQLVAPRGDELEEPLEAPRPLAEAAETGGPGARGDQPEPLPEGS